MQEEYPYSDKKGKYCYRTLRGCKVKIYSHLSLSESLKLNAKRLSKKEYGRLVHLINSNPKKWRKGINYQIIDDKVYSFIWKSYDDFDIIGKRKSED